MPKLTWIGKDAVVEHHKHVPIRLLEPLPELSCGPAQGADSGNLIVQGDNLHALKSLLPRYAGQVKCIYIDPPYNRNVLEGFKRKIRGTGSRQPDLMGKGRQRHPANQTLPA